MPVRYKDSPDQRDYYHVGVVTKVSPYEITHCTSVAGGIKRDEKLGKWGFAGRLKRVSYEEGGEPMPVLYEAEVYAKTGSNVNLREQKSLNAKVIMTVPIGAGVDVLDDSDPVWSYIDYANTRGYMMKEFLKQTGTTDKDVV